MLTELLMHYCHWDSVWYAGCGKFLTAWRLGGRWFVGVWTGSQYDLICVKRCETNKEAEKYLSPGGRTILSACLKAVWKRLKLRVKWKEERMQLPLYNPKIKGRNYGN